jgi:hypothetical protein
MVTILRDIDAKLVEVADALARADDHRTRGFLDETWAAIDSLSTAVRMLAKRSEENGKAGSWMRALSNGSETRDDVTLYILSRLEEAETLLELARAGRGSTGNLVKTAECLIESIRSLSEKVQAIENQG